MINTRTIAAESLPSGGSIGAWFVGDAAHGDFAHVLECLRHDSRLRIFADPREITADMVMECVSPELILIAQSRPGAIRMQDIESLRRRFPLAGIVSLLSSWCEGQSRTGRPIPGAEPLYWHEFEIWWQRQHRLRSAGRCANWAWPISHDVNARALQPALCSGPISPQGLIVISTPHWETADALADVLKHSGYASVWQVPRRPPVKVRGVIAGMWEGRQLDDGEASELHEFCRRLSYEAAPVVALLDFPRRERAERARQLGAAQVLGKPWINAELMVAIEGRVKRVGADVDKVSAA